MAEQRDVHLIPVPDATRAVVGELVERYRRNADAYRKPSYKEAQCRAEFIDPFFEALGWDMQNKQGYAEQQIGGHHTYLAPPPPRRNPSRPFGPATGRVVFPTGTPRQRPRHASSVEAGASAYARRTEPEGTVHAARPRRAPWTVPEQPAPLPPAPLPLP